MRIKRFVIRLLSIFIPSLLLLGSVISTNNVSRVSAASESKPTIRFWLKDSDSKLYIEITYMNFESGYNEDDVYCWFNNYKGPIISGSNNNNTVATYSGTHMLVRQNTIIIGDHYGTYQAQHRVFQFPFCVKSAGVIIRSDDAYYPDAKSGVFNLERGDGGIGYAYQASVNGSSINWSSLSGSGHSWSYSFNTYSKQVNVVYPNGEVKKTTVSGFENLSLHMPNVDSGYKARYYSSDEKGEHIINKPICISRDGSYFAIAVKNTYKYYVQCPNGTPYLHLWNGSETTTWPGIKMSEYDIDNHIYVAENIFYADWMIVNNNAGSQSPNINCNRLGSVGINNVYSLNTLDTSTYGKWISINEIIHPNGPTMNTFRVFLNKDGHYVSDNMTWSFHYWNNAGSIDVEIIRSGYVEAANNGMNVDAIWIDYFDIPKEAIGLRYQFKLYSEDTGQPYNYYGTSNQVSTDSKFYVSGDNSNVWYLNDNNNYLWVSFGALCDSRSWYNPNFASKVLESRCTCNDDKDTGTGNFSLLKSQYKLEEFEDTKFVDYATTDYGSYRGEGVFVHTSIKIAMMEVEANMRNSRNNVSPFVISSDSVPIIVIIGCLSILTITVFALVLIVKKKKIN